MTMSSKNTNEVNYQEHQPALKRCTAWKKVVSIFYGKFCCFTKGGITEAYVPPCRDRAASYRIDQQFDEARSQLQSTSYHQAVIQPSTAASSALQPSSTGLTNQASPRSQTGFEEPSQYIPLTTPKEVQQPISTNAKKGDSIVDGLIASESNGLYILCAAKPPKAPLTQREEASRPCFMGNHFHNENKYITCGDIKEQSQRVSKLTDGDSGIAISSVASVRKYGTPSRVEDNSVHLTPADIPLANRSLFGHDDVQPLHEIVQGEKQTNEDNLALSSVAPVKKDGTPSSVKQNSVQLPRDQTEDIANRSVVGYTDVQGSLDIGQGSKQTNGDKSLNHSIITDGSHIREAAERTVITSAQSQEEIKDIGKTSPGNDKLRRLFPECELLSQSDLNDVLDPATNEGITLGKGAFGEVRLMRNTKTGRMCAVKTFLDRLNVPKIFTEAKSEVQMLNKLRGLHCVPELFGIVPAEGNRGVPSVVEEFVGDANSFQTSTLRDAIQSDTLSAPGTYHIALNIVQALTDIHSRGVLHCDLKTDNIMVMPHLKTEIIPQVKIIDFGHARNMDDKPKFTEFNPEKQLRLLTNSTQIAPEVVFGDMPYTTYSDIYSLGMVLIKLAGNRFHYLKSAGKRCADGEFRQRPTLAMMKQKLTSYIDKKKY